MSNKIRVIDLFAGPGGLGEGFSAFRGSRRTRPFHIAMSVEKEASAHKTLELRAMFRQFSSPPEAYYSYVRGDIFRDEFFDKYPEKADAARAETLYGPKALGPDSGDDDLIYARLDQLKHEHAGPWVVIGGPPCQAYSLVGRARNKGIRGYKAMDPGRHFLYEEYLRVLTKMQPEVFVMENVKGILSSQVNGQYIFPKLLDDLRCPRGALGKSAKNSDRYKIYSLVTGNELDEITGAGSDCIIRSEEFGIPQSRHRVILLGVRADQASRPSVLKRAPAGVTADQVLSTLPKLRSGLSKKPDSPEVWAAAIERESRKVAKELKAHGLDPSVATAASRAATRIRSRGSQFVKSKAKFKGPKHLEHWIPDERLGGYLNHETRGHIVSDLARYLYCSCYANQKNGTSPRSHEFPKSFAPIHANWESGKFADRFRVQAKGLPSSTVTSHISKDGHYFIHYDPAQCRSLTVREAARLQTFPDNYFFEGTRTQQYVQVGNAVPPWLAKQIAKVVYGLLN